MNSKPCFLLAVILLTATVPVFAEEEYPSLQEAVQGAQALARDRDFKGAEVVLMEALEQPRRDDHVDNSLAALWLLGLYRSAQEDYDGAALAYRERLDLLKEHSEVTATLEERQTLQALAEAYDNAGRGDEARMIWMRLAELGRKDPASDSLGIAYFGMARSFAQEDQYEEALEYFDKTLDVRARWDDKGALFNPLVQYAKLLRELGKVDEAEKLEKQAQTLMAGVVRSSDASSSRIEGDGELLREWPPPGWESSE